MPKEHEAYRDNLAALREFFLPKRIVNTTDAARYLGCDRGTVRRRFDMGSGVTLETFARMLCKM